MGRGRFGVWLLRPGPLHPRVSGLLWTEPLRLPHAARRLRELHPDRLTIATAQVVETPHRLIFYNTVFRVFPRLRAMVKRKTDIPVCPAAKQNQDRQECPSYQRSQKWISVPSTISPS